MPRWLLLLERWLLRPDDREFLGGDLQEDYLRRRRAAGPFRAGLRCAADLAHASGRRWAGLPHRLAADARFAARTLRRRPGLTVAATLTLALGIGATAAIFVVADAVLLTPLPYPSPDRLLFVSSSFPGASGGGDQLSYADIGEIEARTATLEAVEPYHTGRALLLREGSPEGLRHSAGGGGEPERVRANFVGPRYLSLLGARAVQGRLLDGRDDQAPGAHPVVVVSHDLWTRRLGADPAIVGRVLALNDVSMTVVGVLAPGFRDVSAEEGYAFDSDVFLPVKMLPAFGAPALLTDRTARNFWALARVADTASIDQARADVAAIGDRLQQEMAATNRGFTFWAVRLDAHLARDIRGPILLLAAGSAFVLLIACANVANLLFARVSSRGREIAVRRAIGARGGHIAVLVMTEAAALAARGGLGGLAVAAAAGYALGPLLPGELAPRLAGTGLGLTGLLFVAALAAGVGLLLGALGAIRCAWRPRTAALGEAPRGSVTVDGAGVRRLLLVVEVAFALMLVVGAMLMLDSLSRLRHASHGFDPDRLVTFNLELGAARYRNAAAVTSFAETLRQELAGVAGVEAAALWGPGRPGRNTWVTFPGREDTPVTAERMMTWRHTITPGALAALRIPLVAGREFTTADTAATQPVVIVSETIAKTLWPGEQAIGRRMRWRTDVPDAPLLTVVGVAADASHRGRLNSLLYAPRDVYVPLAQRPDRLIVAVVRAQGDPAAVVPAIRARVRALDPGLPLFDVATMDQHRAEEEAETRFAATLMTTYGALALTLAAVGISGVLGYHVTLRRREMAVRMALGASRLHVIRGVVVEGLKPTVAGILLGVAGAAALSRFMSSLLFEVEPRDPATFAAVSGLLALTALLATLVPARAATRADPMETLRTD